MRTLILAGGRGSRLGSATAATPKPLVAIGDRPILWHICRLYAHHGLSDFLVAAGHLGEQLRAWADAGAEPGWSVQVEDTGPDTHTGGRLRRLRPHLDRTFAVAYGDGVGDVDLTALLEFHRGHGRLATITAVHPPARFGHLTLAGDTVEAFVEKPHATEGWVNGGYFVFEPDVLDRIPDDATPLEGAPLASLAADGQLMAWRHEGFWHPMDTPRDRDYLEGRWLAGDAPWRVWA